MNDSNFGFSKVSADEKKHLVSEVFSDVAGKYNIMNDLMSLGIHRLWKKELCKQIPNLNSKILDVAGGTGDVSFKLIERGRLLGQVPDITICDINPEMLKICKKQALDRNFFQSIKLVEADAEKLPFYDNSFDYYTIAFGIRNVVSIEKVLQEAYRVLKPTGKFICMEFSKIENKFINQIYHLYSFNFIPLVGKMIANNESAYRYLAESIALFPKQDDFKAMIYQAGFTNVSYKNLTSGIVAIHTGYKI